MQYETKALTFEVSADDVAGKETIVINGLGRDGWEPWCMFTSPASGAWKFPVGPSSKIWVAVWLKRAIHDPAP